MNPQGSIMSLNIGLKTVPNGATRWEQVAPVPAAAAAHEAPVGVNRAVKRHSDLSKGRAKVRKKWRKTHHDQACEAVL